MYRRRTGNYRVQVSLSKVISYFQSNTKNGFRSWHYSNKVTKIFFNGNKCRDTLLNVFLWNPDYISIYALLLIIIAGIVNLTYGNVSHFENAFDPVNESSQLSIGRLASGFLRTLLWSKLSRLCCTPGAPLSGYPIIWPQIWNWPDKKYTQNFER